MTDRLSPAGFSKDTGDLKRANVPLTSAASPLPSVDFRQSIVGVFRHYEQVIQTSGQSWPTDKRSITITGGFVPSLSFAGDVPAGNTTAVITHNLASTDVAYQLREKVSGEVVETNATITDANTITLTFVTAPTTGQYRIVVFA